MPGKILSIGHNIGRLRFRNTAIQKAGYHVVTTQETALVLDLARKQRFDAIVICNSIPSNLRESIARELKRLRGVPPLLIVCEDSDPDCFKGLAEEVVYVLSEGTQQPLIEAIRRVVKRHRQRNRRKAG